MKTKQWIVAISVFLYLISILAVNSQSDRSQFTFITGFYSIAFFSYLLLIANRSILSFKNFLLIAIAAQILSVIYAPFLSDDYYRFIWDGEITWSGLNPFDKTPKELYSEGFTLSQAHLSNVYSGLSALSKEHYSCYPPVNQFYFILATAFTDSIVVNTIVLKLLIILTECVGAIYLVKTLKLFKIDTSRMWLLYLNPLWIIECTGNVHFEGVMVSFLFVAFYFLMQQKQMIGGIFFALAIQIKLIPLMLLPFFYRFLGFRKSMLFYLITITLVLGLGFIQLNSYNISHFTQSLRLYFEAFEFNSFVLHYYVQYGKMVHGWNLAQRYVPKLARLAIAIIMILALYGQMTDWKKLFKRMTLAFFIYLALSSNVHPWYILPLLALSIFTNYSFPLFGSFLIFFSYGFYAFNGDSIIREVLRNIEYIALLLLFIYEMLKAKSPIKFLRLDSYIKV